MNILVGIRGKGDTADCYYRAVAPWSLVRYWSNHEIRVRPLNSPDIKWADVVIFQRSASPTEELLMREAKAAGKLCIYDCDDNLFDIPPSAGELYLYYWEPGKMEPKPPLQYHSRMLQLADVVTVPTQALGDILSERTGKALNVKVLPNCVMRGDWDWQLPMKASYPDGDPNTVTVGWMGHLYHWDDFMMVRDALDRVICEHNARLVILGFPEVTRMFSPRLLARTKAEDAVPFRDFGTMRQLMSAFDVGILPLADTPFNRGKSPLKLFQMGAAGVPVVASKTVYGEVAAKGDDGGCYFQATDQHWGDALSMYIDHRHQDEVKEIGRAWQRRVWERHCYESFIEMDGKQVPQALLWLKTCEEAIQQCR